MKQKINWKTISIAVILSVIGAYLITPKNTATETKKEESVYDRVMKSGTIKCGYFVAPPHTIKDAKTGEISGITYDIMEGIGKKTNLKVEWVEETSLAYMLEGLNADRYDMMCGAQVNTPQRAAKAEFLNPLYYLPFFPIVKKGDTRFLKDINIANDPKYKIAYVDGSIPNKIKNTLFPKASSFSMQEVQSSLAELLEIVNTNKADLTFFWPSEYNIYNKNNPDRLDIITKFGPVRLDEIAFIIKYNEDNFKGMINSAINTMILDGSLSKILKKYQTKDGDLLIPNKPYSKE